ncbi:MAG TPA: hypothetical protein VKP69_31000, partial [Isosphaeraceae bacterium]|nr:hypothetical protein [Isosphaeraceae bacterium]
PVRPSQINAPVYHRASIPTNTAVVPEAVPPDPPLEDLVADWRTWASQPRHPLSAYARKMLARVEGDETGSDADRAGTGP